MESGARKKQAIAVIALLVLVGVVLAVLQVARPNLPDHIYLKRRGAQLLGETEPGWTHDYKVALLEGAQFTDEDLARLLSFPTLERISLRGSSVTDEGLQLLEKMPELLRLDLSGTQITGEGLRSLIRCRRLWDVGLNRCPRIGVRDLTILAKSKRIRSIDFDRRDAAPEVVLELIGAYGDRFPFHIDEWFRPPSWGRISQWSDGGLPSLTLEVDVAAVEAELGTSATAFHKALLQLPFRQLVTLLSVDGLWTERESDRFARLAEAFPNLERFHQRQVTDQDALGLARCRHMKSLTSTDRSLISDVGLSALGDLSALTELELESPSITGPGLSSMGRMRSLQTLILNVPNADGAFISSWDGLQALTSLQLRLGPQTTGAGLEPIGQLRSLETLHLCAPAASAEFIASWAKLPALTSLHMELGPVGKGDGLRTIGLLTSLKSLYLIVSSTDAEFVTAWPELNDLTFLSLNLGQYATADGLDAIGQLRSLNTLHLMAPAADAQFLAAWTGLQRLNWLYLNVARPDGKNLAPLARLKNLRGLGLPAADLSDAKLDSIEAVLDLHRLQPYAGQISFVRRK